MLLDDGVSESRIEIVNTFHNIFRENASRQFELRDQQLEVRNSQALMHAFEKRIEQESEEVVMISPYLWMSEKQIHLIKAWLLKDPKRKLTVITNSIMTSDNVLAQIMVDSVMGPELMLDRGIIGTNGKTVRHSIADQVKIYEFGHLDSTDLGGSKPYGKLHMKSIFLRSSKVTIVGTYNNDPRSLLLNSEGAAIVDDPQMATQMDSVVSNLISRSHLWGSAEYHAIRADRHLPKAKRFVAERLRAFYDLLIKLNIWWMI